MFKSISISNFRGIRYAEINDLQRVNLFFGKNNCGKSTVLEAVFLISGQSNPLLPLSVNSLRNYARYSEHDLKTEFYQLNPGNHIKIKVEGDKDRELEISFFENKADIVDLNRIGTTSSEAPQRSYGLKHTFHYGDDNSHYASELIMREGDTGNAKTNIDSRYMEVISSMYLPANFVDTSMARNLGNVITHKQEATIIGPLREIDPNIRDIQIAGQEILVDMGYAQRLPFNMMGDGLRKLLTILVSIYQCRDGVLLIDEIDNGFHFSAMRVLWKAILKSAVDNNVQLFISTHNIDSLKGLAEVISGDTHKDYRNEVAAFKLIRKADDKVVALKYDPSSFIYSVNQQQEMR